MGSIDRKPYQTATVLNQDLLDEMQGNLLNGLRSIIEIEAPNGDIIRVSDRNTYVGEHFYEARTEFPSINRNVGDWLGGSLIFSEISFQISNVDGKYNKYLPAGDDFENWQGQPVELRIGLGEQENTYISVFKGTVSNEGGFSRNVASILIKARNDLEKVNTTFPTNIFKKSDYPKADNILFGKIKPIVYGDWYENVTGNGASLSTFILNDADLFVNGQSKPMGITIGSPTIFTVEEHRLDLNDIVEIETDGTFPTGLTTGLKYVKQILNDNEITLSDTLGGAAIDTTGTQSGSHTIKKETDEPLENLKIFIADNAMEQFTSNDVWLFRTDLFFKIPSSHIVNISANKNTFEIKQDLPSFQIDGENWTYSNSDIFLVKAKGKEIDGGYNDNPVWITRDILKTYGGLVDADFNSDWAFFRDKPSVSITKARAYISEEQNAMEYSVSLMEQVALEPFINRNLKFAINSLHFDDWENVGQLDGFTLTIGLPTYFTTVAHRFKVGDKVQIQTTGSFPTGITAGVKYVVSVIDEDNYFLADSYNSVPLDSSGFQSGLHTIRKLGFFVRNWDLERNTFQPETDLRNNFDRARAPYNYLPNIAENGRITKYFRNQASISQNDGIANTKAIIFPNLYQEDRVEYFLKETLKLTSAFREVGNFTITPRGFLLDISDFIKLDVKIGSSIFDDVPFMIREITYDPATLKIGLSGWIMSMIPFPGYEPNYPGTVGGYNATITEE